MRARSVVLIAVVGGLGGCAGPVDLFQDEKVQQALAAARAKGSGCGWGCADPNGDGICHDDEFKLTREVTGTWQFTDCKQVASATGAGVGTVCAGSVTFTQVGPDRLEQSNVGPVSVGSGSVTFASDCSNCLVPELRATHEGVSITQHNSARGAGCSQELTNIISLNRPNGTKGEWQSCVLTVVLSASSGCLPADWWKVSRSKLTR